MEPTRPLPATTLTAPTEWPWAIGARPLVSSESTPWRGALLRSWSGTSPVMVQPPLDHHYLVMHLGGAKRVNRSRDGAPLSTVVDDGSLTLVPAGTAYHWRTEGPIAFAHLYLRPQDLDRVCAESIERESRLRDVVDRVGCRDRVLEPAFQRMLDEIRLADEPSALLLDSLLESVCLRLALRHMSQAGGAVALSAESLAPHRLRRVIELIDAHFDRDLRLADLVAAAGTSQFHFSRAFQLATGESPYRYLMRRRMDFARVLLLAGDGSLAEVSAACGFNSRRQFSVMFKRMLGVGPKRFRLLHRSTSRRRQDRTVASRS